MKDQVDALKTMGVKARLINSSLSNSEYSGVLEEIENDECKIIYIAPERLDSMEFVNIIRGKNISQVAIDEAHCVSQWGHDFRVSYKKIPYFINRLDKRPIVTAFTATASNEVREDIINILNLHNPAVYITGFDRENLSINIVKSSSKNKYTLDYVENHKNESGIIYASTRKEVETIYEGLLKRNYSVAKYHAGLSNEARKEYQENFINDDIKYDSFGEFFNSLYVEYQQILDHKNDLFFSVYACNSVVNYILDSILKNTVKSYSVSNFI